MLGTSGQFARRLLCWYQRAQRALPWRVPLPLSGRPDPYHVLVSELMLQQTQVATVIPYFERFLVRFPTLADLAVAPEQDVLRLWQGLGYYARARNLQQAARRMVTEHGGVVPATVDVLLTLPGLGRYTAGAVASIAFGLRAPILDGNVVRVICRIDAIEQDPRETAVRALLWKRADEILPARNIGDFNSALMELGATVCTPRNPQCLICPVREHCQAREAGIQDRIPPPRKARPTPLEKRNVLCIRHENRWLIEQRPPTGRWAGMWQFIARPANGRLRAFAGLPVKVTSKPRLLGRIEHQLTHRRYEFAIRWAESAATAESDLPAGMAWSTLRGMDAFPMPRPHVQIASMLADLSAI